MGVKGDVRGTEVGTRTRSCTRAATVCPLDLRGREEPMAPEGPLSYLVGGLLAVDPQTAAAELHRVALRGIHVERHHVVVRMFAKRLHHGNSDLLCAVKRKGDVVE